MVLAQARGHLFEGYADVDEARSGIAAWFAFYNRASQHPSVYVVEEKRLC